jgi:hypothetical protein
MKVIVEQVRYSTTKGYFVVKVNHEDGSSSMGEIYSYSDPQVEEIMKESACREAAKIKDSGSFKYRETILEL